MEEYRTVGMRLAADFKGVDIEPFLKLVSLTARLYRAPALPTQVCDDPDDDKFLACALASGTKLIVTGDKSLLKVSGYRGIKILTAREFIEKYIRAAT